MGKYLKRRARALTVLLCCLAILCAMILRKSEVMGEEVSAGGTAQAASEENSKPIESTEKVLSNGLFMVTMPDEAAGTYVALIDDRSITITDKQSKEAAAGGCVFSIKADAAKVILAGHPNRYKCGELTLEDGTIYDIVVSKPTDVQFNKETMDSYKKLREFEEEVIGSLEGVGKGVYAKGAGIKGEDLYQDVLAKYVTALSEGWNAAHLEKEQMNPVYELIGKLSDVSILERVGYAYKDITGEGIEELLIGEVSNGDQESRIYDIYGIEDHTPVLLLSGSNENSYYLGRVYLINKFTGYDGVEYINVLDTSATLQGKSPITATSGVDRYKIDRNENKNQPWFRYYISDRGIWEWVNITEEEYNEKMSRYRKDSELQFRPLSELLSEDHGTEDQEREGQGTKE